MYQAPRSLRPRVTGDDAEETQQLVIQRKRPYSYYEHVMTAAQIHFYLSDDIKEPELYTDMIHRILTAGPSDVVFIHLNTPGGQLDTGIQIINAMQNSPAKIVTVLESMAHSMGTMLFLAGDEMIVNDHCLMMFHTFSSGAIGKGNELTTQLDATVKLFQSLAKKLYVPFLTDEELTRIMKGEDIWMQSSEVRKRLDRMMRIHQEQEESAAIRKTRRKKTAVDEKPTQPEPELAADEPPAKQRRTSKSS